MVWTAYPLWRSRVAAALDLSPQAVETARQHISDAASIVEQMLADTRHRVSRRSRARPDRHRLLGAGRSRSWRRPSTAPACPRWTRLPPELRAFVDELRNRRAGRLVLATYAAARPDAEARARLLKNTSWLKRLWIGPGLLRMGAAITARIGSVFVFGRTALVVRWADVAEVLSVDTTFKVGPINARKVNTVTGPFVLGLDRGAAIRERAAAALSKPSPPSTSKTFAPRVAREADRLLADAIAGQRTDRRRPRLCAPGGRTDGRPSLRHLGASRNRPAARLPGPLQLHLSRREEQARGRARGHRGVVRAQRVD